MISRSRLSWVTDFYPRPPRGGRHIVVRLHCQPFLISIHALREEGDFLFLLLKDGMIRFLSTPSARRATPHCKEDITMPAISIHALREEGDRKNGEKHLRFCFIIKRSAQIWKSLSKNIRKNSCDLHRTA